MRRGPEHIGLPDLELLVTNRLSGTNAQEARVDKVQEHLRSCPECTEAADMHAAMVGLKHDEPSQAGAACTLTHSWYELAEGMLTPAEAAEMLAHASQCSRCSLEMRMAQEDLDGTDVEEEVASLQSSSAAWQDVMARRLVAQSQDVSAGNAQNAGKLLPFPSRRMWIGAIAAILLLALGSTGWRLYRASSEDALLAQAYDVQRRTELRLPGGSAVPLASMNRGGGAPPVPTQLLRLRLRAQEHLDKDPNNPYWHGVLGRIALVENNGEVARQELGTALALNSQMPGLKRDLAAAYFEIGEGTSDPVAFARAADLYGEIIDHLDEKTNQESVALLYFDRALSWERQSIYHEAIKDYEQALALERDPSWRHEIELRLNAARAAEKKGESQRDPGTDRPTATSSEHSEFRDLGDDEYELYLDKASRDWLPRLHSSEQVDHALRGVAAMGMARHDRWLSDMLLSANDSRQAEGVQHLARAFAANARGDSDGALSESAAAKRIFQQAGTKRQAGMLRAEVEMAYSLQRQGRAQECLKKADPLLQSHALEPYIWLHVYLLLNRATCSGATGDVEQFTRDTTEGMRIAREASLPLHVLRAEGFLVASSSALGDNQTAWKLAQRGLGECVAHRGTRMPSYQFLQSIYTAVEKQLPYTAAGVADAASYMASYVSNVQIQAYAYEVQGRAETTIGHDARAAQAFGNASTLLQAVPSGRSAQLYRADWEADRAELLAHNGHVQEALARLRSANDAVTAADDYAVRQVHHTEFARLLLLAGDTSGALRHTALATRDAEHALATTSGEAQRLAWERTNGRGYRLLVQGLSSTNKAADALRAWEWYRSAPYRRSVDESAAVAWQGDMPLLPDLPLDRLRTLTLVVARLDGEYAVWSVDGTNTRSVRMVYVNSPPNQIEENARTLTELCARRDSSEQAIHAVGRQLYRDVFGSFQQQIEQADAVQVDLDPSLQQLPIAALVQSDGRYMGLVHPVVVLPAWWSVRPPAPQVLPARPHVLLVEGRASGLARDGSRAMLPQQYLETNYLQTLFPSAVVLRGYHANTAELQRLLPSAEVFHYSGHTTAQAHQSSLLLGGAGDPFDAKAITPIPLHNLRLAVLATCSSTGGSQTGVNDTISLTHALLAAGAANVIATLWDVDSLGVRDIMVELYERLNDHATISEALRLAQQQVQSRAATAHPFFWAPIQVFAR